MRKLLLFCLLCSFSIAVMGQDVQRRINFNPIDNDSLNMSLNADYNLIEDSCATIIRHVRFSFGTRKFHGRFTDIRKDNSAIILTEGNYNVDGLKDGIFILRYDNGNIRAKGAFKNDAFIGKWELFYESGKPELTFEANEGVYDITDAWDANGGKTVDKGSGNYVVDLQVFSWKGKLSGGRPDGTWKMYKNSDPDKETVSTEHFKKGEFVNGENAMGEYANSSRIKLVEPAMFPFVNTESMKIGTPCNMQPGGRTVTNAHYKSGMDAFNSILNNEFATFFYNNSKNKLSDVQDHFEITGDISTEGRIVNLTRKGGSSIGWVVQNIIKIIQRQPQLIPATIDGKPVKEQFKITLDYTNGEYSYTFKFLPLWGN
jgi:antitoxin component YwqK of YwqJK toxin-antitoxin module